MRLKALMLPALMMALAGSACTASDNINQVEGMAEDPRQEVLVAGVEAADDTPLSSDLVFYVHNTSDAEIDMLIWNTPLEKQLSADVFTVTLNDSPVDYQGRMVKRSSPTDEDFLTIPAHERVEARIDITEYYAMSESGDYTVSFTPMFIDGYARLNEQTMVKLDTTTVSVRIE